MSISRLNLDTAEMSLQSLYTFLNANKAGTFLGSSNVSIALSDSNKTLTISTTNATFSMKAGYLSGGDDCVTFAAGITNHLVSSKNYLSEIQIKGAMLCNNGLIIEVCCVQNPTPSAEIVLTVDNTGELAVIYKKNSAIYDSGSPLPLAPINGYRITATDSSSETPVTLTPQFGAGKTSLAPIVPMCNNNAIFLPHAFAALHTQASAIGLQTMAMGGVTYITNGCWYIKDGV